MNNQIIPTFTDLHNLYSKRKDNLSNHNYNLCTKSESFDIHSFLDKSYDEQIKIINDNPETINFINNEGNNILFSAIEKNNYNLLKFLLEKDPNLVNSQNIYKETLLHKAVENVNHKLINLLLEKDADGNIKNQFGETPLHIAALKGEYKVIKLLLLYNCDPTIRTNDGFSAEEYAQERGYVKCVSVLQQKINDNSGIKSDNHSGYDLSNGMEKSPINHISRHRPFINNKSNKIFERNKVHEENSIKSVENKLDIFNVDKSNLRDSSYFFHNKSKNLSTIESYQKKNEMMKKIEEMSIMNNYVINKNKKMDIPGLNIINMKSYKNLDSSNMNYINKKADEYFYDDSEPIKIISSTKNDINCYEKSEYLKRKNSLNFLKRNNTRKSVPKISVIQKEENTLTEKIHRNSISKNLKTKNSNSENSNPIIYENENEILYEYLSQINMEKYTSLLIKEGFDDITMLIEQMKGKKPIMDIDLKKIGILKSGDRAKILIKFQLDSRDPEFQFCSNLDEESIFHNAIDNNYENDIYLNSLNKWLKSLKLKKLYQNFFEQGYHSLDLLLIQMLSKNPLTEDLLKNDLNIDKHGYRLKIINKLLEDSSVYLQKNKFIISNRSQFSSALKIEKGCEKNLSCNCFIY